MNPIGPLQEPDLRALLQAHAREIFAELNCHQLGTVVKYDPAKYTVSVQIVVKRVVYNQPQTGERLQTTPRMVDYPVLVDVPVFVLRGGGALLYMPVKAGDTALVLFNDRDLDAWFETGSTSSPPNSPRLHDLSDGLAIIGFFSKGKVPNLSGDDAVLTNGGGSVQAPSNGWPSLNGAGGSFVQVTDKVAIHSGAGGRSLKGVLDDLVDALDLLFVALSGWVNTGGSTPNPATLTAITAAKTAVDAVKTTVDANFA